MTDRWHCQFCHRTWPFLDLYLSYGGGYGCPRCRGDHLLLLCDEPWCESVATEVWTTTENKSRRTCGKHRNYWREQK